MIDSRTIAAGANILQDKDGNSLRLNFLRQSTASSSYELVSSNEQLTNSQFSLEAVGSYGAISYKGGSKSIAFVNDTQGTTIKIPEIALTSDTDTPNNVKLSASIFIP